MSPNVFVFVMYPCHSDQMSQSSQVSWVRKAVYREKAANLWTSSEPGGGRGPQPHSIAFGGVFPDTQQLFLDENGILCPFGFKKYHSWNGAISSDLYRQYFCEHF